MSTLVMRSHKKPSRLFPYLLTLSMLFFVLQLIVYLTVSADFSFLINLMRRHAVHTPPTMFVPQIAFLFVQIALYTLFAFFVWSVSRLSAYFLRLSWRHTCQFAFALWFVAAFEMILANQVLYPASSFAIITSTILPVLFAKILLGTLGVVLIIACLVAVLGLLKILWQKNRVWTAILTVAATSLYLVFELNKPAFAQTQKQTTPQLPNIIFIGIDSLRPDYTGINDPNNPNSRTPHLDQFLKSATIFTNAITPLARTFPSWTSILTGETPVHTHARFNLEDQNALNLTNTLPDILKKQGYVTYYATDERRFSNISHRYGFDHLVGPDQGVNDFILGTINDLPMSNLIANTRVGQWLFPYNSGNRAAAYAYVPQTFNDMAEQALLAAPHQPIFFAIHFCLPHWPYTWSKQVYSDKLFPGGLYALAAKQSDEQAAQFIAFLQAHHFLDHAIVIVLSDHGEGILRPDDRVISRKTYVAGPHSDKAVFKDVDTLFGFRSYHFDSSYGHGSDILSFVQFHTVLALRTFGIAPANVATRIDAPVTTMDIKPTILQLLHLASPNTDGISLAAFVHGERAPDLSNRIRFSETGFNPIAMQANQIDIKGTVLNGIQVFQVNPSCSLEMHLDQANKIIPSKQRAVLYRQWILALYPQHPPKVTAVLVNRTTGQWTDDLGSKLAQQAPLPLLLQALKNEYGQEITPYCPFLPGCIKA